VQYLDLTFASAPADLACDEALLDACDDGSGQEVLRFWEPETYFIVTGYSNAVEREINAAACHQAGISIFRRCSGGGTVLEGPGCLNYSLVLRAAQPLDTIGGANRFIMERQRKAMAGLLRRPVEVSGWTDLTIGGLKFSGNAQRRKRNALLFHGTFLLRFDLNLMDRFLKMPSRQPDYRIGRPHDRFLMNLDVEPSEIKKALRQAWSANLPLASVPDCRRLVAEQYAREDWNRKF
jgi:lipoate-protein ligase A